MPQQAVAITGIGTLTPAGRGVEALWEYLASGNQASQIIDSQHHFDASKHAIQVAGQVPFFEEPRVLTPALLAQTGRCSHLALVTVLDALDMARLPHSFRATDSPIDPERVAFTIATVGAGWSFLELQMNQLWRQGVQSMDRYGLTAGFLAGPQGHITIHFGIEGRARTFVSERISGANALIEGARAIQRGDAEIVIAGGSEAPLTPLAWAAYHAANQTHPSIAQEEHLYPSSLAQQAQALISEGSTFLVLEAVEHARRRGVPLLAELHGWHRGTDPMPLDGSSKQAGQRRGRGIHASLDMAGLPVTAIDPLVLSLPASEEERKAEEAAIAEVFPQTLSVVTPGAALGHLQGAATATDVAIAVLALHHQRLPFIERSSSTHDALSTRAARPLRHALVLASGLGGMYASLLISKLS